ncbi:ABC transporter permease [Luteolibacter marinus]|uniref:ABC transporter permease n=1 Tax=Luteolibacter marinus TaxID=2776705 RepID=UPI001865F0A9|nr:FtsX-like permease family protein [Luteolibacter marinus]
MTARTFILRGLRHYRGAYLGVLLGSALGAMVLLGALFSGDSVKSTLRQIAEERTGRTTLVLAGGENFFRAALSDGIPDTAPILQLRGQVDTPSGRSTGQVNLFGVTPDFWSFSSGDTTPAPLDKEAWAINRELARSLDLKTGDTLVIRLGKPGLVSRDAPLSGEPEELVTIRGKVATIRDDDAMGRFGLEATQLPSPAIFLPLNRLATSIERPGAANLLLFGGDLTVADATTAIRSSTQLADYGLSLQEIPLSNATEIRSDRIFLPPVIEGKLRQLLPAARPLVTYLANTIASKGKETPYSMVTGADPAAVSFLPDDLAPDEIVLNSWEAEDLGAGPGDKVTLSYYVLGSGNRLDEDSSTFTVRDIVPLEGAAADKLWMPDFPGIAEADNSSDWTPGLPLDLTRIRDKDETYWDDHRGTPKAFIPYAAAEKLWSNRWGSATALRFPAGEGNLEQRILDVLEPADAGLLLRDLGAESRAAAASPVDIAGLFLSMSFFLILAAVALTAMLFRFNVEQRNHESGLLAALGIPAGKILRWRLLEGAIVVTIGSILGALLAFAYTRGLLLFLESIWNRGGERLFRFHAAPASVVGGILGFIFLMMVTIWFVTRRQAKRAASLRLESGTEEVIRPGKSRARWLAPAAALAGLAAILSAKAIGPQGAFFLAGFSFLVAGLALFKARGVSKLTGELTPARLARLNIVRRPTRSLVVVGCLAAGLFLVVSVTAFQKHGGDEWKERSSSAGGFAFWIETTTPVHRGAADDSTADLFKLGDQRQELGEILPFRVGTGDDASCFNLNSVTRPRLLATDTAALEKRGSFTVKAAAPGIEANWSALREGPNMRAFIDETTLLWVLKKKLGDTIDYTDEQGSTFPVEIAGTLDGSVFQGSFVVDEQRFLERYPSTGGYQLFLADAPGDLEATRALLQRSLTDLGATVTPTAERLAAFHSVENTYISIFNVLGGLGVILGAAGLGLVTARNLAERNAEFAQLQRLGIAPRVIRSIVFRETRRLLFWALGIGLVAALVSILPALPKGDLITTLSWIASLALMFLAIAAACAWLAYRKATPLATS